MGGVRVDARGAGLPCPRARGLQSAAAQRPRDRGGSVQNPGSERALRGAFSAIHTGIEHTDEDESSGGAVHAAGRKQERGAGELMATRSEARSQLEPGAQGLDLLRVNLIGLQTIVRKEVRRVLRIWVQ